VNNIGVVTGSSHGFSFMMLCEVCIQWDSLNATLTKKMQSSDNDKAISSGGSNSGNNSNNYNYYNSSSSTGLSSGGSSSSSGSSGGGGSGSNKNLYGSCGYEKYRDLVTKLLREAKGGLYESKLLLLVLQLKNSWFKSLMEIGWKIIVMSCGVPGFKFGKADDSNFLRNDMYLSLIPPFVRFKSKGEFIPVPLDDDNDSSNNNNNNNSSSSSNSNSVSYHSHPSRSANFEWSTTLPSFRSFLTDASKWRGGCYEEQQKKSKTKK
jgi:hypothetical protein